MSNSIVTSVIGIMILFMMIGSSVVIMEVSGVNAQFGMDVQDPLEQTNIGEGIEGEEGITTIDTATNSLFSTIADLAYVEKLLAPLSAIASFLEYIAAFPGIPNWVADIDGIKLFMQLGIGVVLLYILTEKKL